MIIKDFTFQRHETLFYSKNPQCIKHLDPDQVKVVALWIVSAVDKKGGSSPPITRQLIPQILKGSSDVGCK